MKKHYLAIIFAFSLLSACTFNIDTGTGNSNASSSSKEAANSTNSASTTAENKSAVNTATAPKKEEAKTDKKAVEPSESKPSGTRVQFAKGETSTQITKDIPANGSVDFLINAQKGQTMGYTVGYDFNDSDIEAFLTEPGLQDISMSSGPKEPQEFTVNKSGDHRLTVNNTSKKKITITLYLDIE